MNAAILDTWPDRFRDKVSVDPEGCWRWIASLFKTGYGKFNAGSGRTVYAHRYAWELLRGAIPPGKFVCHSCDNPACVRPSHLFLGSHRDNMNDMRRKGRQLRGEQRHNAILTESQVRQLRAEYPSPTYPIARAVAANLSVHPGTIWDALTGKTWVHL